MKSNYRKKGPEARAHIWRFYGDFNPSTRPIASPAPTPRVLYNGSEGEVFISFRNLEEQAYKSLPLPFS